MTISEAIQQFEKIKIANSSQGVQKACQKFIVTLKSLEERDLNIEEQELLRLELDQLDFNRFSKASAIRKSYRHFLSILHKKLSLTRKNFFAERYGAIGLNLGVLAGIVIFGNFDRNLGISIGLALGMLIGYVYGASLDRAAEADKKVVS